MRDYEPYYTEDGSIGLYSFADKDVFHSKFGALTEAWEKFVIPSKVDKLLENQSKINVLDICFGVGYNTKSLMSFLINHEKLKIKKINILKKIILKTIYIVAIRINKLLKRKITLSERIEAILSDKVLPEINIDCLDINEQLIKLSPMFITLITPQEIFSKIIPTILDCFDTYYKIQNIFVKFISIFYPKNKKKINELLELKFKYMHREKEYRVNQLVNYILLNRLYEIYQDEYPDKDTLKIFKEKYNSQFFDKSMIKYANFNQFWGYNKLSKHGLSAFLHNIYYSHLSRRYKNIDFKAAESMFNIKFYIEDARKSIKQINRRYDCIFLDAFTYTKAPQLWSVEFVAELVERLKENGVLLTYSNSAQIRNTFLENNLYVGKIFNEKTGKYNGTIASKDKSKIEHPLNNYEIGLCNTKAGIPYHDPNLSFEAKDIMDLREYEFRHSELMSSSKYMKMRSMRSDNDEI